MKTQQTTLTRGDIITSRRHKGELQVAWGGVKQGYYVCRKMKQNGLPGQVEVIVRQSEIYTQRLKLFDLDTA